jgi:hypothetical protein
VEDNKGKIIKNLRSNETEVKDVESCETYTIKLYHTADPGKKCLLNSANFTLNPLDGELESLTVENITSEFKLNSSSIVSSWSLSRLFKKCVKNYEVRLNLTDDVRNDSTDKTEISFPEVFACADYTLEVNIILINGTKLPGVIAKVLTPPFTDWNRLTMAINIVLFIDVVATFAMILLL